MYSFTFIVSFALLAYGISCLTQTSVKPKSNSCGLLNGGAIIQQVSTPIEYPAGLFWSVKDPKIALVDKYYPAIGRYTLDGKFNHMPLNRVGKEFSSIFPIRNAKGLHFVVGVDQKLVQINVSGSGTNLSFTSKDLLVVIDNPDAQMIKAKVDTEGRLWYSVYTPGEGSVLYKIDHLQKPVIMENDLQGPGGMGWSGSNRLFYLVDGFRGFIYEYDFVPHNGKIKNRRVVFDIKYLNGTKGSISDLVVDTDGNLWIGLVNGGAVVHFNPNEDKHIQTIVIPAQYISALEFGGTNLDTLFVATTRKPVSSYEIQPGAGAIYGLSGLGAVGIPDNEIVI